MEKQTRQIDEHPGPKTDIKFFPLSGNFSHHSDLFVVSLLAAVSILIFWQTTGFELVWDDTAVHLTENPYLNPPSLKHLLHFWTNPYQQLYIPVAYNLWGGLKIIGSNTPFAYHLANILLHLLNGILVFVLLRQFAENRWAAMAGAMVFVVHPVQVESVAWVSEFRGLLAAFFSFSALYVYIKGCHEKYSHGKEESLKSVVRYFFISWILFVFGLLSKPSAVVMPLFAVMIEYYWYRPANLKRMAAVMGLFFIPVALVTVLTSTIQVTSESNPVWAKPLIFGDTISFYLYKLFIPFSLAASYARTPAFVLAHKWVYLIWTVPAGLGVLCWRVRKKAPLFVLSVLLFIAGFLPVSGLMDFSFQAWSTVADRYLYLSMFGAALAVSTAAGFINQKWQWGIILGIIVLFAGWSALVQTPVWNTRFSLWNHCIKLTPTDYHAYINRGRSLSEKGAYEKALLDYNHAIQLNPDIADVYNNRGKAYSLQNDFQRALSDFNKAILLNPKYADAYYNRALLNNKNNEPEKALSDYNTAISINPNKPGYYSNRGIVFALKKDFYRALSDFNTAVSIDPEYADAYNNKAVTLFYMKEYQQAVKNLVKAQALGKKINPGFLKELKTKAGIE